MTGIDAFLEVLAAAGVRYIFGNPGTTELPLNAAIPRQADLQYIFGIHEIPIVAAADGFAQARAEPAVANVHISCGLGNAMGMLYNAYCAGTPLVLTAGQQDRRLQFEEPVLYSDLARVAAPWVKWSYEVKRVEEIPQATRRALQIATAPPTGPVFLALPVDVQLEQIAELDLSPPSPLAFASVPPQSAVDRAADILSNVESPVIIAGSRVASAGAIEQLVSLAERLAAPVYSESHTSHGRLPFPPWHPLYLGPLPLWSPEVHMQLSSYDALVVIGADFLRQYIYQEPADPIPDGLPIVQVDNHPFQVGKNYAVSVGIVGEVAGALAGLTDALANRYSATETVESHRRRRAAEQRELRARAADSRGRLPMSSEAFIEIVADSLPDDAIVVQEAITTVGSLLERLGKPTDPYGYYAHRGWALGWGLGFSLGVKLAHRHRPVLSLLGDGSALYGIQGLWTAAKYGIGVVFVVCNNRRYQILDECLSMLDLPREKTPGIELTNPEVDFVSLAESFGVAAVRIESFERLREELPAGFSSDRPVLLEVPVAPGKED